VSLALLFALFAATCPTSVPAPDTPGFTAVAKLPAAEAMRLNAEGKQLYRQERWAEARGKYRAALIADPDFLSAQLNVACSFSRQGRYAEAADEAATLIRRAFVPWNREVLEAADLGILQDQPVYAKVQAARSEEAARWGKFVRDGVLFVARTKPPLSVAGQGVLVLGLNQELFAWIPETGRYLQVTAEDGHVLAFAVSTDGRRIAYLLGGKVIRSPGQADRLRGLSLRVLDLPTMSLGKPVSIPGDAKKVQLSFLAVPELRVTDATSGAAFSVADDRLQYAPTAAGRSRGESADLSVAGVEPGKRRVARPNCGFTLAMQKDSTGLWRIQVSRSGRKPFTLDTRYGAGLAGLPFPDGASPPRPAAAGQGTVKP
jgi:hypothetical protein